MALLLRSRKTIPNALLQHRLFSTSNSGGDDRTPPPPRNNSPLSSFIKPIKSNLNQPSSSNQASSLPYREEIHRNLAKFRSLTSAPPPGSPPSSEPSLEGIYTRRVTQNETESAGNIVNSRPRTFSFQSTFQKLRKSADAKGRDHMSSPILRKPPHSNSTAVGGTSAFPGSIFGRGTWQRKNDGSSSASMKTALYEVQELGEKLKKLRPQGKGNEWFSIAELNERLKMLRELEEKESQSNINFGLSTQELKECLVKIAESQEKSSQPASLMNLDLISQFGGTPTYMDLPPQEHLVEKYFHPDNMSSAEKMKIELAKVREEFKMSESDCGSARVQVAQLTTKIKHLSAVLHKKDKHSRKGLLAMVQKRKRLLKYLRRTDWDSYCFVISKLGLRDNPEHTYRGRTGSKVPA